MSNINLIIEERPSDIGNFMVGRLLPFRGKRMVGPFIFIDHMGPAVLTENENLDIAPHPHIGLSTLTYLFEGHVMHKDSLGTEVEIKPGQVNWMTAGAGIVHSERTPQSMRGTVKNVHGLQIWVALPKDLEQMEPSFYHADEEQLPSWTQDGLSFKLVAGEIMGHRSPVPVYSRLYYLEIKSTTKQTVNIGKDLYGESALYILEGSIESVPDEETTETHVFGPKQILIAKDSSLCTFTMAENTTVYLFGGEIFPEERFIYWNFVASTSELIEAAKQRWIDQAFARVPGETDFVPLPEQHSAFKPKHS